MIKIRKAFKTKHVADAISLTIRAEMLWNNLPVKV